MEIMERSSNFENYKKVNKQLNKMITKDNLFISGKQLASNGLYNFKWVSRVIKVNNKYKSKDINILNIKGCGYTTISKGFRLAKKQQKQEMLDNLKEQLESRKADVRLLQKQIKEIESKYNVK